MDEFNNIWLAFVVCPLSRVQNGPGIIGEAVVLRPGETDPPPYMDKQSGKCAAGPGGQWRRGWAGPAPGRVQGGLGEAAPGKKEGCELWPPAHRAPPAHLASPQGTAGNHAIFRASQNVSISFKIRRLQAEWGHDSQAFPRAGTAAG